MDLIGDMLTNFLQAQAATGIVASQLRPPMRLRLSRIPLLGRQKAASNADRLLNRFVDYPRWLAARLASFDLFHLVDHSYSQLLHALPKGRAVVTCHDLDTFRCLLEPERDPRSRYFRAMTRRILDGFLASGACDHGQPDHARGAAAPQAISRPKRSPSSPTECIPAARLSPIRWSDAVAASWMPAEQTRPKAGPRCGC